ncbi:amino acid ABC transporter substrate-binding protein [Nitratireductor soli]|uniref:amino acid ABC transporter substrate-binding protein n=1 Tax=Nitratireductor soli TaxID=1670619 RepID=UPI0009E1CAFB|nr:amino acid ABC transporter substrate-binding protein [Nitratireductor soli]
MTMVLRGMLAGLILWCGLALGLFGAAQAADGEIVIGAPVSLTGPLAADGQEQRWAYELAVKDINEAGGIFIKEAGKKLPVRLVVAGAIVAEKYKKFYMMTTCFPFMWSPQNFKWSALFFFTAPSAAEVPFKIWNDLPEADRPKNPALLSEDTPDGHGFGEGFRAFAKQYGYTFAVDEPWAVGAKDYSANILKMKANNVDALLIFGSPSDSITLVRQMKELGLSVKYLHGWKGTWTGEFAEALGSDSDYVISDGFWSQDFPFTGSKELGECYTAEFHKPSVTIGAFYANAQVLFRAIERVGTTDSAAVRDAVVGGEYKDTVVGDLQFNDAGLALIESTANQWWEKQQMLFYPPVDGGWQVKMMKPWGER